MQLHAGDSVWLKQSGIHNDPVAPPVLAVPGHGPLTADASCEVAIIGAGITAALVGQALAAAGVDVLAVDRRMPAGGSTAGSTGLIQYELDVPLLDLIAKRGSEHAMEAYRLCGRVLAEFPEHLQACGIRSELPRHSSLFLASRDDEIETFHEEARARQACDINARVVLRDELLSRFHIDRPAAILSDTSLAINPFEVTLELWRSAVHHGLKLHTPCTIKDYDAHSDHVILRTSEGYAIKAKRVVFATGYETPSFLKVDVQINTTYAMATQTDVHRPGQVDDTLVWESARPYLYIRPGPQDCLIVGGEDDPWTGKLPEPSHVEGKIRRLLEKMRTMHPSLELDVTSAWAGVFAQTPDGLPYIGQTRQYPLGYFALGYGGNGILFSFLAARIIEQEYTRKACPSAWLFRFER